MAMNTKPKVSFIMPSYRDNFMFRRAVKSVIAQSFKEWELIIIDNNFNRTISNSDPRIRVYKKQFTTCGDCFNVATDLAESDYILNINDDDANMVERALITYEYLQRCDAFIPSFYIMNQKGKLIGVRMNTVFDHKIHYYHNLTCSIAFAAWDRRTAPRFKVMPTHDDWCWLQDCCMKGIRMAFSQSVVGYRTVHDNQSSVKRDKKETMKWIQGIRDMYKDQEIMSRKPVNIFILGAL